MPVYDPTTKLITLDDIAPVASVVTLDVLSQLYSDAKIQWLNDLSLNKYVFPWVASGGDALPVEGRVTPRFFFLRAPWTMKPYEADHGLFFVGNIFREDGAKITSPTIGDFTVEVNIVTDVGPQQSLGGGGSGSFTDDDRAALQTARDHARSADLQTQRTP